MARILNLETSTKNCSVSVSVNGHIASCEEQSSTDYIHAEKLHTFIAAALEQAGINFKELDAVAVSHGPGSYTGLRIGVSAAKGLCFALNIPLIALDTTAVLAEAAISTEKEIDMIIAAIDARRDEIYTQQFNGNGKAISAIESLVVTTDCFGKWVSKRVAIVGDAAQKTQLLSALDSAKVLQEYPSARHMGKLSERAYHAGDFADVAYHEPYYLKDFIAGKPKKML
jgi:tRNA threonylcarbamoyladenosine biosynthesis protein TsaB